jgi:hypothetical protein
VKQYGRPRFLGARGKLNLCCGYPHPFCRANDAAGGAKVWRKRARRWRPEVEAESVFPGDTRPHFTGGMHDFDWVLVGKEMRIEQDEDEPCPE